MRSILRHPRPFSTGLTLVIGLSLATFMGAGVVAAAPKAKPAQKKSAKELSSSDDALDKQMDWENKILGPNTEKKIDLAKIQKLQAEETARREKQEKIDKVEKERREREEAAAANAKRNVKSAGTHDVPEIEEAPPPPKPAEKHDDAFVDKLLKDKGVSKKKSTAQTNDDVDQLLNANKQEKPVVAGKKGRNDSVDQLLATADKEPTIKTTTKRPTSTDEPVSAEVAAREAAMKAIAAASAKNDEERNRTKRPFVPDAAVLRARAEASARANPPPPSRPAPPAAKSAAWSDPFASDAPTPSKRDRISTTVRSPEVDPPPPPTSGRRGSARSGGGGGWKDPFDAGDGGGGSPRSKAKPSKPAKPAKHPPNWKDPFA